MLDPINESLKSIPMSDFGAFVRKPVVTFDKRRNTYELIMLDGLKDGSKVEAKGTVLLTLATEEEEMPISIERKETDINITHGIVYPLSEEVVLRFFRVASVIMGRNSFKDIGNAIRIYIEDLGAPGGEFADCEELQKLTKMLRAENESEIPKSGKA